MQKIFVEKSRLYTFLLSIFFFFSCQQNPQSPSSKAKPLIPVLNTRTFQKTLIDHRGHPLVVNFFTTWCEPCREELPDLISVSKIYKSKGVSFLAISLDKSGQKVLSPFLKKIAIPFPVYLGDQSLMDDLKIQAIPVTRIYNRKGKLIQIFKGRIKKSLLMRKLDQIL